MKYDTTIAPTILSSLPIDDPDSVMVTSQIEILFSRQMDTVSTKNAISINPPISGIFSWEENEQKLIFFPDSLAKSTRYTVTVGKEAKSVWNVNLDSIYSFSFSTKNRDRLNFVKAYPANNQENISTTVQIRLYFDEPVLQSSLSGRVKLFDNLNDNLNVVKVKIFSENGLGVVYFEPQIPLDNNSEYKVVVSAGIEDSAGFTMQNDVTINFRTEEKLNLNVKVIDDFENLENWSLIQFATDTNVTSFKQSNNRKIDGSYSGRLLYRFISDTSHLTISSKSSNYMNNIQTVLNLEFGFLVITVKTN